jgi:hypothetical protein
MRNGDNQLTTTVAAALPATPSRARPLGMIHHHGTAAPIDASTASRFRTLSFIGTSPPP